MPYRMRPYSRAEKRAMKAACYAGLGERERPARSGRHPAGQPAQRPSSGDAGRSDRDGRAPRRADAPSTATHSKIP
jgi:hypothetical protein